MTGNDTGAGGRLPAGKTGDAGARRAAVLMMVVQNLIYGFGDPISKIAYDEVPVFTLLTVRYAIAFFVLLAVSRRRLAAAVRSVPVSRWLIPGMCIALSYILSNISLAMTAATSVAFLRSLAAVMTPVLAWAVFRDTLKKHHIAVQLLVVLGVYLLCGRGGLSGFGVGEVITLIAAALMAGALVFGQHSLDNLDSLSLTTLMAGCSTVSAFIGALIADHGLALSSISVRSGAIILYLAIAATLTGYLLQNMALDRISSRSVALLQCLCPVLTGFFSFLLLGETLTAAGIAGAALIILCVVIDTVLD